MSSRGARGEATPEHTHRPRAVLSLTVPDFQPLLICIFSFATQSGHTGYLPFDSSNFIFLFSRPTHFSMCQSPAASGKEEEKHCYLSARVF